MFRSAMENAGLQFRVECQPIAEQVYVDRDMWEKIVLNLLSNAFKFTFEGEVAVTLKRVDGAVELQVRDTGVGIPEEHRERVFERFHRIEGTHARTHEGTGIGLALVHELAKLHGGSVRVESAVGAGSTFTVAIPPGKEHLPAERLEAAQPFASTTIRAEAYVEEAKQWLGDEPGAAADVAMLGQSPWLASSPEPERAEKRELIILADDNADMRRYVMNMLGDRYEVHAVADGRQALEATRELRPALVLTDIMMPRLDGFGLLRAIRDDSALAGTPVILLSARAGEEWRVQGLQADADDYLVKPFTARELLARVAMHVRMAKLRRETVEREERLRSEAELEREKLRASEERLAETSRLYLELQRAEAELQREGQNFRLIVDTVPGFLCTMTARGEVEFVNQGIRDYTGWTLEQLADWRPLLHPDEREMVMARWIHSVKTGDPYEIEHRIRGADGVYRWFMVRGLPVRDAEGGVVRWYILITDIDERKKTHEKLQRSEAFLAQGQQISQTGSFGWNVASGEIYWSEETYNIVGYDRAAKPTFDLAFQRIHPDDRDFVRQTLDHATREKTDLDFELRFMMTDGRVKHVHIVGRALHTASGNLDFVGAVTDITAAKQAEEMIRQSESELRQILDVAPQHVYVLGTDPKSMRLYVNKAALDYLGLTFEEWRTRDLRDLIHPDDWERTMSGAQNQTAAGLPHEVELRLRRKDGKYRWFLSRRNPLRDEHGRLTRWYTAATDIHDRKAAEQRLQDENVSLREEIDKASMFEEIVGTSAALKQVLSRISKVAPTDSSVLITGETGTGKELVARAIHRRSERSSHPFVSVNCAVIPRDLIASELFGHEKGAFTGATQRRLGRFELAEKGTIFLDEVGELPAETQIALLRVLQEREFERIGGTGTLRADVRVIAATNRDLEAAIAAGTFRSDLFYRLNVFPVEMPPLRKRREDIPLLVTYFLNRYARKAGRHFTAVDKKSLDRLQAYAWPGNIRELQNVIERSVIVNETQTFSVDESWFSWQPPPADLEIHPGLSSRPPAQEKAIIEAALRECGGRVYGPSGAAARLGIPRTTLESKIKSLKINKNRFRGIDPLKNS
jgi:formate hydrogenlyase transcriptional activator